MRSSLVVAAVAAALASANQQQQQPSQLQQINWQGLTQAWNATQWVASVSMFSNANCSTPAANSSTVTMPHGHCVPLGDGQHFLHVTCATWVQASHTSQQNQNNQTQNQTHVTVTGGNINLFSDSNCRKQVWSGSFRDDQCVSDLPAHQWSGVSWPFQQTLAGCNNMCSGLHPDGNVTGHPQQQQLRNCQQWCNASFTSNGWWQQPAQQPGQQQPGLRGTNNNQQNSNHSSSNNTQQPQQPPQQLIRSLSVHCLARPQQNQTQNQNQQRNNNA